MIDKGELIRPGPLPKTATLGFLTENMRDFLKMSDEEKRARFEEGNIAQYRRTIKKRAEYAIEDLFILVENYDENDLKKIISIDDFAPLIAELIKKIGSEERKGRYGGAFYLNLVKAIELGMTRNKSRLGSDERIKIEVTTRLVHEGPY